MGEIESEFPDLQTAEPSYHAETPNFSFLQLPLNATPGAYVSSIRYSASKVAKILNEISVGQNTIFGITGFRMVSESPVEEAALWFDTLSPEWPNTKLMKNSISNGFQSIDWISGIGI